MLRGPTLYQATDLCKWQLVDTHQIADAHLPVRRLCPVNPLENDDVRIKLSISLIIIPIKCDRKARIETIPRRGEKWLVLCLEVCNFPINQQIGRRRINEFGRVEADV